MYSYLVRVHLFPRAEKYPVYVLPFDGQRERWYYFGDDRATDVFVRFAGSRGILVPNPEGALLTALVWFSLGHTAVEVGTKLHIHSSGGLLAEGEVVEVVHASEGAGEDFYDHAEHRFQKV